MSAAYFEDHPTDPTKVIMRKPRHDDDDIQDYVRPWRGLTEDEAIELLPVGDWEINPILEFARAVEAKLKEKNT
jgi:hypothetical protein